MKFSKVIAGQFFYSGVPCSIGDSRRCDPRWCEGDSSYFPGRSTHVASFVFSYFVSRAVHLGEGSHCWQIELLKVLYAGEGESRKPDENSTHPALSEQAEKDKVATIVMKVLLSWRISWLMFFSSKGHEFVAISFHMPASCEACTKPLWAPFRPPPAVECRSKHYVILNALNCWWIIILTC